MASILHDAHRDHPDTWQEVYDQVYTPLVKVFEADNPRFKATKFSWAVATGEGL
jgi:hypothetical protein